MNWCICLKKKFADAILEGRKDVELRTRVPKSLCEGDRIFVCVSGTHGQIPFSFKVKWIGKYGRGFAWKVFEKNMCVSLNEFRNYTKCSIYVYIIKFESVRIYDHPLSIDELGLKIPPMWFNMVLKELSI